MVIFALFIFLVSGLVLMSILDPQARLLPGRGSRPAISILLGMGLVSLQMFLYSLVSIPYSVFSISIPWISLAIISLASPERRRVLLGSGAPFSETKPVEPGWLFWLILLVIISQVFFAFFSSMLMPISGWDAWGIWFLKANAFFVDGGVESSFLLDSTYTRSHQDYPLLLPLSITWLYICMGTAQ